MVRHLYLYKMVQSTMQDRRCMRGGLDAKIWKTWGRRCMLYAIHLLLDSMILYFLGAWCCIRNGSTALRIRGSWVVRSPLFTSSLTCTRTLIWTSSFRHCIIFTLVVSSETVITVGPFWITSYLASTTEKKWQCADTNYFMDKTINERLARGGRLWQRALFSFDSLVKD